MCTRHGRPCQALWRDCRDHIRWEEPLDGLDVGDGCCGWALMWVTTALCNVGGVGTVGDRAHDRVTVVVGTVEGVLRPRHMGVMWVRELWGYVA